MAEEDSLAASDGPVRMLFQSPTPDRLPRSVILFANLQGFRIGVSVEVAKGLGANPPSSANNQNDHKDGDDDPSREQTQTEDQSQSDCHWKRRSSKEKEKGKDTGASGDPMSGATKEHVSTPPRAAAGAATAGGRSLLCKECSRRS
jgi:hypothetical protein